MLIVVVSGNRRVNALVAHDPLERGCRDHGTREVAQRVLIGQATPAGLGLHSHDPDTRGRGPVDGSEQVGIVGHGHIDGGQDHIVHPAVDHRVNDRSHITVRGDTGRTNLALFSEGYDGTLGLLVEFFQRRNAVNIENVDIVGLEPAQAPLAQFRQLGLGLGGGHLASLDGPHNLGGDEHLVANSFLRDDVAHHLFVTPVLVACRGVEMTYTDVVRGIDHERGIGIHYAHRHDRHTHAGAAQGSIDDLALGSGWLALLFLGEYRGCGQRSQAYCGQSAHGRGDEVASGHGGVVCHGRFLAP